MALLTGIVFLQLGRDQTGVKDRQGVLFFMVLGNAFPALQATLLLFHAEKRVFNRERMGGAYRVSTYYLSKTTTDMPISVAPLLLFVAPCTRPAHPTQLPLLYLCFPPPNGGSLLRQMRIIPNHLFFLLLPPSSFFVSFSRSVVQVEGGVHSHAHDHARACNGCFYC
jgi:hypothetical protein